MMVGWLVADKGEMRKDLGITMVDGGGRNNWVVVFFFFFSFYLLIV